MHLIISRSRVRRWSGGYLIIQIPTSSRLAQPIISQTTLVGAAQQKSIPFFCVVGRHSDSFGDQRHLLCRWTWTWTWTRESCRRTHRRRRVHIPRNASVLPLRRRTRLRRAMEALPLPPPNIRRLMVLVIAPKLGSLVASETSAHVTVVGCAKIDATKSCPAALAVRRPGLPVLAMIQ